MSYEEFVEFHKKNPEMDNTEYYEAFPDVNKSTIRSWKSRANQVSTPTPPPPTPTPPEKDVGKYEGYEENQKHYIQLLMTQTETKEAELKGLDMKSKILVLRNRLQAQQDQKQKEGRGSNSSILPAPAPIGQNKKEYGIDDYIVFDENLNEIRMEIPWDVLFDPEKNKALGELKNK